MNKTELAIIQQIADLDESQQQQILVYISRVAQSGQARSHALGAALDHADKLREQFRQKYGDTHFNTQAILDEIREESSE